MDAAAPGRANCTSTQYCAQGFSANVFINLKDNSAHLDPPGFSPVGVVRGDGMNVVDALYAGYGEVADLCPVGQGDHFCVGEGAACQGVNMTQLVAQGTPYVKSQKPLLDFVLSISILQMWV